MEALNGAVGDLGCPKAECNISHTHIELCQGVTAKDQCFGKNGVRTVCAQEQTTILNTLTLNHLQMLSPASHSLPWSGM